MDYSGCGRAARRRRREAAARLQVCLQLLRQSGAGQLQSQTTHGFTHI